MQQYDKIIIGAGLYGLYSALFCAKRGQKVLVLEHDDTAFKRATFINQARVHMGYHYPRSYSTAIKSAGYFNRFNEDYAFCVLNKFDQVYATSTEFSWSDSDQFIRFCKAANIRCDEVAPTRYFKEGYCDGAFLTEEYTYDAQILKNYFLEKLKDYPKVEIIFRSRIKSIDKTQSTYKFIIDYIGKRIEANAPFVLNSTYASVNQIQNMLGYDMFKIKYELCEIILCNVNDKLHDTGLTVMDGPFFSIMPFGKTGYHSLTAVTFTPHVASKEPLPRFDCQARSNGFCSSRQLGNCNDCPVKPESAWPYMSNLARKYMRDDLTFEFDHTLYSMKPILLTSEIDDSRPTVIRTFSEDPIFVSVLSGKINTVYDLDEILSK
ncbi:FAD-dependent oxidoreductase [uncultured Bacteroides sp.]|uniref:FAD-dependent oxidoreductase n=1 Tax=uncultured Bacteroides sp. TaxID=162156 RepID=UPI0026265D58|nr:FAD-dependent oxidoreductase [uncultured Bacteroides sp.]